MFSLLLPNPILGTGELCWLRGSEAPGIGQPKTKLMFEMVSSHQNLATPPHPNSLQFSNLLRGEFPPTPAHLRSKQHLYGFLLL